MIGDDVKITILGVDGNQVKIGVEAPRDIAVYRKEIYLEIKRENEATLRSSSVDLKKARDFLGSIKKEQAVKNQHEEE